MLLVLLDLQLQHVLQLLRDLFKDLALLFFGCASLFTDGQCSYLYSSQGHLTTLSSQVTVSAVAMMVDDVLGR